MWGLHDGMGWWMLFGGMAMIIFWAIVIWLVVWGVTRVSNGSEERRAQGQSPLDIVERRLARGEITRAEFEDLKKILQ